MMAFTEASARGSLPAAVGCATQYQDRDATERMSTMSLVSIEVLGVSERSFSAATQAAASEAGRVLSAAGHDHARFEVLTMRGTLKDGRRASFEVRIRAAAA